ncbi:MAG: flagellar biosynthesis protein [Firmicutes bacterium]|jgi:flagellar operon protein|nr:flagellar biosynthesis protein [Bacillota bacterium]
MVQNIKNNQVVNGIRSSELQKIQAGQRGVGFEQLLQERIQQTQQTQELQFSKHAKERIDQRGIEMTSTLMNDLNNAVAKAKQKGAKDVVVIGPKEVFIVNVPNNIVVTTLSGAEMKNNIFTKIDSAVIL